MIPGRAPEGLYADEAYRAGLAHLGERGYTFDTWHYHHQNAAFRDLAQAVPGTTMVLDHFGTPLGVGVYEGKREEIWAKWGDDIQAIAIADDNVQRFVNGKEIRKVIVVPGRLVTIVV